MSSLRRDRFLLLLALLFGGVVAAWGPLAPRAEAHPAGPVLLEALLPVSAPALSHACPDRQPSHRSPGWHRASCRRLTRWLGDGIVPEPAPGSIPPVPVFVVMGNAKPAAEVSRPGTGYAPRATGPRAPPALH